MQCQYIHLTSCIHTHISSSYLDGSEAFCWFCQCEPCTQFEHSTVCMQCKCFSHTQCSKLGALFFQEISHPGIRIQRFWLMMPKPPFPPQVPLEPHFKGEWWVRLAGLSGLSFNHKWDPLPTPPLPCLSLHPHLSLSTSLTLPHCPRSLPLWVREIAVSALSSFSPPLPPPNPPSPSFSAFMLFQPITDRGHQFHRGDSPVVT